MDEIPYIRLIDGTIIPYDKFEGEIPSDAKVSELYKLLQVGDYAKIEYRPYEGRFEREIGLFRAVNITGAGALIYFCCNGTYLCMDNGVFECREYPTILLIMTKEKYATIEFGNGDKNRSSIIYS